MPTSDDALLVAIAVHILVFPPAPGGPTGLQDLNGVTHWHNQHRVVADCRVQRLYGDAEGTELPR